MSPRITPEYAKRLASESTRLRNEHRLERERRVRTARVIVLCEDLEALGVPRSALDPIIEHARAVENEKI